MIITALLRSEKKIKNIPKRERIKEVESGFKTYRDIFLVDLACIQLTGSTVKILEENKMEGSFLLELDNKGFEKLGKSKSLVTIRPENYFSEIKKFPSDN